MALLGSRKPIHTMDLVMIRWRSAPSSLRVVLILYELPSLVVVAGEAYSHTTIIIIFMLYNLCVEDTPCMRVRGGGRQRYVRVLVKLIRNVTQRILDNPLAMSLSV